MPFVPKKQAFNAHINEVVLGVGEKATAIGGQNVLPFHWFDAEIKNAPKIGVELTDFGMSEYALKHQSQALPLYNGALWTDEHDCYWLNPYSNDVQGYLTSIALELAGLGFDEVLFDNFYFPDSDRISWTGSVTKQEAILDAADNLSANLLNQSIRLDLGTNDPEVAAYGARAFITTNNASQIEDDIAALSDVLPDTASQLVYLTDSRDTRFDACGALRPLLDETE